MESHTQIPNSAAHHTVDTNASFFPGRVPVADYRRGIYSEASPFFQVWPEAGTSSQRRVL